MSEARRIVAAHGNRGSGELDLGYRVLGERVVFLIYRRRHEYDRKQNVSMRRTRKHAKSHAAITKRNGIKGITRKCRNVFLYPEDINETLGERCFTLHLIRYVHGKVLLQNESLRKRLLQKESSEVTKHATCGKYEISD